MEATEAAVQLDFFDPLKVCLSGFEGPLELLLELIRKHKMDIQEVPLAEICQPYLEYIDLMEDLNLEIAGEFLSIASTLLLIKSRSLLPQIKEEEESEEEGLDPEEELRRKLIEYQRYKELALELEKRYRLDRDFFIRPEIKMEEEIDEKGEEALPVLELSIYSLLKAYQKTLKKRRIRKAHEIEHDENPIEARILELMEVFQGGKFFLFKNLLSSPYAKTKEVITFIAILELCKMKLLRVHQIEEFGPIHCKPSEEIGNHVETFRKKLIGKVIS